MAMLALLGGVLAAQASPHFSVVSIREARIVEGTRLYIGAVDPALWRTHAAALNYIIGYAYGFRPFCNDCVEGLPDWADKAYDINASIPPGTKRADVRLMVRTMLARRFKLRSHIATRRLPAATLTIAPGGPHLRADAACSRLNLGPLIVPMVGPPAAAPAALGCGELSHATSGDTVRITFHGFTMGELAAQEGRVSERVLDRTGLAGAFDFTLVYRRDLAARDYESSQRPLVDAFRKQLGLVLTTDENPRGHAVPVVVVDHVENPTPN